MLSDLVGFFFIMCLGILAIDIIGAIVLAVWYMVSRFKE